MTNSTAKLSHWYRQRHVVSSAKVVGILSALLFGSLYLWGLSWQVKVLFGLGCFFFVALMFEMLGALLQVRNMNRTVNDVHELPPNQAHEEDFQYKIAMDGNEFLTKTVVVEQLPVTIHVGLDRNLQAIALPIANSIASAPNDLARAFSLFREEEATRNSKLADLISSLKIKEINFYSRRHPEIGEVYFVDVPGADSWACLIENGKFKNLGLDT